MKKTVIELFAGVGGFRVGLNNVEAFDDNGRAIEDNSFDFVWSNQWEPSTKTQHASDCYKLRFGNHGIHSNEDISKVDKKSIPDHSLLCGGFPCQDYSVARSLSNGKGIEGKKGVLWWQIVDILKVKQTPFVFLENVDRLIKSPAKQRGRDFGIMLRCLNDLDYTVEWRVINAAEYGLPQRRRRIYIFAYKNNTKFAKEIKNYTFSEIMNKKGIFARAFPVEKKVEKVKQIDVTEYKDLVDVTENFAFIFENTGLLLNGIVYTEKTTPIKEDPICLNKIVLNNPDESLYLNDKQKMKFDELRGSKKIPRIDAEGHKYFYSEGSMSPFDELDKPGRTMLTSEGSINRSTHIIKDPFTNKLRILSPIECERLNQFPDDWTNSGMPQKRRYFMMGNALVCGIVKRLGKQIKIIINKE